MKGTSTIARAARRAVDHVPAVRALGGTRAIDHTARETLRAQQELGGTTRLARELLGDIPAFGRLLWRLARDERVAWRHRGTLMGLTLYIVSPIDVIPDWIPVIGAADDLLLIAGGVRWVLGNVDPDVLSEHWDGEPVVLELLTGKPRPIHVSRTDR